MRREQGSEGEGRETEGRGMRGEGEGRGVRGEKTGEGRGELGREMRGRDEGTLFPSPCPFFSFHCPPPLLPFPLHSIDTSVEDDAMLIHK